MLLFNLTVSNLQLTEKLEVEVQTQRLLLSSSSLDTLTTTLANTLLGVSISIELTWEGAAFYPNSKYIYFFVDELNCTREVLCSSRTCCGISSWKRS
jgi:hypothetical protein